MKRKIIEIDEARCDGCGLCANACHEGAIGIVHGKAKLLRDDYCDGMGDCLPACPRDAIHFVEREAAAYDESAVAARKSAGKGEAESTPTAHVCPDEGPQSVEHTTPDVSPCGCSDSASRDIEHTTLDALACGCPGTASRTIEHAEREACACAGEAPSRLTNFPVQLQLAPVRASYFDGANLLVAADCTAYAYGAFHEKFIKNRATLIGCPKLDGVNYAEKLAAILQSNDIRSVTLTRMTVPCCGGLERMAKEAIKNSGKQIPLEVVTIAMDGEIARVERG